ncbi:MAG TPA: histidine kinase, partial [Acidimicrobiia bacterium]|nr:histidine kinase [Acidimicrobiia bacterium]
METKPPISVRMADFGSRIRRTNPWIIDALIATVFLIAAPFAMYSEAHADPSFHDPDVGGWILTVGMVLPFYFRRRAPFTVFCIGTAGVMGLVAWDYPTGITPTLLLVGVYTVAAYAPNKERYAAAVIIFFALVATAIVGPPDLDGAGSVVNFAFFASAYFFGTTVRNRRLYLEELEARALSLERERDEEAHRAVAEERLHIAQELHDIVAHSMGVIAVQAGVGAYIIEVDRAEAKKALENISQTSRSALAEIRRMLGVLREDEGAEYAPAPGLADLERLVHGVCDAGIDVHVTYEGTRTELPPGVDFTAYRIVQESLTNVLKHGGPQVHADVTIAYEPHLLKVEVIDDGRGINGNGEGGGHGLMGMRERVGVYGGKFQAGPHAGG